MLLEKLSETNGLQFKGRGDGFKCNLSRGRTKLTTSFPFWAPGFKTNQQLFMKSSFRGGEKGGLSLETRYQRGRVFGAVNAGTNSNCRSVTLGAVADGGKFAVELSAQPELKTSFSAANFRVSFKAFKKDLKLQRMLGGVDSDLRAKLTLKPLKPSLRLSWTMSSLCPMHTQLIELDVKQGNPQLSAFWAFHLWPKAQVVYGHRLTVQGVQECAGVKFHGLLLLCPLRLFTHNDAWLNICLFAGLFLSNCALQNVWAALHPLLPFAALGRLLGSVGRLPAPRRESALRGVFFHRSEEALQELDAALARTREQRSSVVDLTAAARRHVTRDELRLPANKRGLPGFRDLDEANGSLTVFYANRDGREERRRFAASEEVRVQLLAA